MIQSNRTIVNKARLLTSLRLLLGSIAVFLFIANTAWAATPYAQLDLVSSVSGVAPVTDTHLKNPWGIALSATSPFWISNNVTGTATLYNTSGQPFPVGSPLVVTIPSPAGGLAHPTGIVSNPTNDFQLGPGAKAQFIFATLEGTIAGWNGASGTSAVTEAFPGVASYTGLALGNTGLGNVLYAANSATGHIDVYDSAFGPTSVPGSFLDPGLPSGFSPYNVQNINGTLFVTYENESTGGGVIDAFDVNGNLLRRVTSNGPGGPLESPWGLALAPASFGSFGGALLVGNEDDGRISAFNPLTGTFLGQLRDADGNPLANPGLWGLTFGNGGNGGNQNFLYFTAGIQNEQQGLFGFIRPVPEPSSVLLFSVGAAAMVAMLRRQRCAS